MDKQPQVPMEVLEAIGAAAQMTSALAVMLAETFERPEIARDFTKLLHQLEQRPGTTRAAAAVYRMSAETLARYG